MPLVGTATLSPALTAHRRGDERDGIDDLRVARAAAQVAGDRLADGVLVRAASGIEIGARRHQHPRRADAALGAAGLEERLLQRVEGASVESPPARGLRRSRISAVGTWQTGTRHESTGAPSTRTVHAPHSPSPQPSFVPVSARSSRRTSRSRRMPGHVDLDGRPVDREPVGRHEVSSRAGCGLRGRRPATPGRSAIARQDPLRARRQVA